MKPLQSEPKMADIFSFLNAISGFIGICYIQNISLAIKFILISALMDGLDGFFARRKGESQFGKELDSLADLVSFGILPALIIFKMGFAYASIPYLLASMYRLARFNVLSLDDFLGLPTTATALILACLIALKIPYLNVIALILSALMISKFRYVKVKNRKIMLLVGVVILFSIVWEIFYYILLVLLIAYVISPLIKVRL